ncbi:unnamed protein product, partial [Mesorhabditis spiculigera]
MPDFGSTALNNASGNNPSTPHTQIDLTQLFLAGLDANSLAAGNQFRNLFQMNQLAQISGGSPSPASSAPSSASESQPTTTQPGGQSADTATPPATAEAQVTQGGPVPSWFSAMLPQPHAMQQQMPGNMSALMEQFGLPGLLGQNPLALAAALGATPNTPTSANSLFGQMTSPQKELFCDVCEKSFFNRDFLKTHMRNKHGVDVDNETPKKSGSPKQPKTAFPFIPASTSAGPAHSVIVGHGNDETPKKIAKMETNEEEDNSLKNPMEVLLSQMHKGQQGQGSSCDECGRECATFFDLLAHRAQEHSGDKENPTFRCGECPEMFDSQETLHQHGQIAHGGAARQLLNSLLPPGFPNFLPNFLPPGMGAQFGLDGLDPNNPLAALQQGTKPSTGGSAQKRTYASNGKNYCDLCNKEVCNKYFLRTHMLKMHGIVIDENKMVIANIDTAEKERMGGITFRCDICMVELKSRNLLRQHKQDQHGVAPISTPQRPQKPPQPTTPTTTHMPAMQPLGQLNGSPVFDQLFEKCSVCEKRVHIAALPQHMAHEHPPDISQQLLAHFKGFMQQSPMAELIPCKFCPQRFKEEGEVQMHMISQHAAELLSAHAGELKRCEEPGVERCPQCPYQTKNPRNMEIHMERHERLNEVKEGDGDDEALTITQQAALKMVQMNHFPAAFTAAAPPPPVVVVPPKAAEKLVCDICDRSYSRLELLESHQRVMHSKSDALKMMRSEMKSLRPMKNVRKLRLPWSFNRARLHVDTRNRLRPEEKKSDAHPHVEGHSHTSGSVSPSGGSLPEGFARPQNTTQSYVMQSFVIRENDASKSGAFPNELLCHLPVRVPLTTPLSVTFELVPQNPEPSPTGY